MFISFLLDLLCTETSCICICMSWWVVDPALQLGQCLESPLNSPWVPEWWTSSLSAVWTSSPLWWFCPCLRLCTWWLDDILANTLNLGCDEFDLIPTQQRNLLRKKASTIFAWEYGWLWSFLWMASCHNNRLLSAHSNSGEGSPEYGCVRAIMLSRYNCTM